MFFVSIVMIDILTLRLIGVFRWATIADSVEEFEIGLLLSQTHRISAWLSWECLPFLVLRIETVVKAGKGEGAEGEGRQPTSLVLSPLFHTVGNSVRVVVDSSVI